jgi:hypothetical protein
MTGKVPFDTTNPTTPGLLVLKGEYTNIPKKSEGGIYSDELVDLIYSMMDLVFYLLTLFDVFYFISETRKTTNRSKNTGNAFI